MKNSTLKIKDNKKEKKMFKKMLVNWKEFRTNHWKMGIVSIMFYLAFQVFADLLAIKMTSFAGLTVSAAFFVYPMTFTFRDLMHKFMGKKVSVIVIKTALLINIVMLGVFWIYVNAPPVPGTEDIQASVSLIFGSMWRIVLASVLAEFVSELVDTEVYQAWVNKFQNKHQWGRVLFSNIVAGPIDITVFKLVAFLGWLPMGVVFANILSEMLLRVGLAIVSIPLIYIAPSPTTEKLKMFVRGIDEIES